MRCNLVWRPALILLSLATVSAVTTTAFAQDEEAGGEQGDVDDVAERARILFLRGDRLYSEGQYEESVDAFRESYELSGRPELLYNLANAYERLGRLEEALAVLREYAPHAPSYDRSAVDRRVANLRDRLNQASRAAAQGETGDDVDSDDGTISVGSPRTTDAEEGPDLVGPIALIAAGGAAAVTAAVLGVLASSASSSTDDLCGDVGGRTVCSESAQSDVDTAASLALGTDIAGGVAAALGAAGVVWLLVELSGDAEEQPPVAVQAGPNYAGVELRSTF